jgi:hypothetical protein
MLRFFTRQTKYETIQLIGQNTLFVRRQIGIWGTDLTYNLWPCDSIKRPRQGDGGGCQPPGSRALESLPSTSTSRARDTTCGPSGAASDCYRESGRACRIGQACVLLIWSDRAARFGIVPRLRTSPSGSATATAIVSAWTSRPKNRNFSFMTGSLPLVALNCVSF